MADGIDASVDGLTARLASRRTGPLADAANFQLMMQGEAVKLAGDTFRLGTGAAEAWEGGDIHSAEGRRLSGWERFKSGFADVGRAGQALGPLMSAGRGLSNAMRGTGALPKGGLYTLDDFPGVANALAKAQEAAPRKAGICAPTQANSTRGWRKGDPINNLTRDGNVPSWDTVRQRFWKNEAHLNAGAYDAGNLARMRKGLAPQRINKETGLLESMELHHTPPQRDGGLFDVEALWPDQHALKDSYRHLGK